MKKGLKKLVVLLFFVASVMVIAKKEVNAAETSTIYVRQFDGSDVSVYKQDNKAPIPEMSATQYNDWIFAGWYTNEACTAAMTTNPSAGTMYYAKFVPSEILNVKCQVSADTTSTSDASDMRLVSSVDSLQYKEVGFEVSYNGGNTIKISSSTVYRKIEAAKDGVAYAYSPEIFELDSEYFITATLKNIANKNFYKGFYIKAYWVTLDGTTVYGTSRYARVEDSYLNIANVPVRVVTEATLAAGEERTATITYDATKFVYTDNIDATLKDEVASSSPGYANGSVFGTITISNSVVDNVGTITITGTATDTASLHGEVAHLRLKANNVTNLPRKNTFQVAYTGTEAVVAVDSVFDYLSIAYSFADREWFANNTSATEFVIATPNELAGLTTLVNDGTFQTQTIYLAADIELNQGKASEWAEGTNTEGLFQWTPIGITGVPFKGIFDGQGHTITGMYAVKPALSTNSSAGLFGYVKGAQIKNLSLVNGLSKMEQRVGSFAASSDSSEFINLYSDVIVSGTSTNVGGLVGELTYGGGFTNCWYDGTVSGSTYVGGLAGRTCAGDIKITGCLNSGSVSSTGLNCGGFVGFSQDYAGTAVTLSNSLNVGSVASTDIVKTGTLIGNVEGKLYVDNNTVHTTQSELTYAFAWFPGTLYDIDKNVVANAGNNNRNLYVPFSVVTDISGDKAYQNTGLDFENTWIARIGDTPVLNQWCESGAIYKYDTEWVGTGAENDPYIIKTANELYGLAQKVNAGETFAGKFIKLGANITINSGTASAWEEDAPKYNWIPIGVSGKPFKGTFDGQGYSIKGMYAVEPALNTNSSVGLFGYVDSAVIKNVSLTNGYAQMEQRVGSFAASSIATEFMNLYSNVIVNGTSSNVGGLVGELTYGGGFTNCWFDGTVSGGTYVGGLAGRTCAGDIKITGCLNSGAVTSTGLNCGGFVGFSQLYDGTAVTLTNSLNVGSVTSPDIVKTGALIGNVEGKLYVDNNTVHTTQSELTYAFAWFPGTLYDIDKNVVANAGNENRNKYVAFTSEENLKGANGYLNTGLTFDRPELPTPTEGTWIAREGDYPALKMFVDAEERMELVRDNMYRADTRWYNKSIVQDGVTTYTVRTTEELVGLAKLVNAGTTFANTKVVLADDITINTGDAKEWAAGTNTQELFPWTPIGINGKPFKGIFDGQGHSITGMYAVKPARDNNSSAGLFGYVNTAVIKNIRLTNGFASMEQRVGSFAANSETTEFINLYSTVIVNGTGSNIGGIVGELTYGGGLTNCWFAGTVSGSTYVGGLAGRTCAGDIKITGCFNSGTVSSTGLNCGGFVGFSQLYDGTAVTLTNSLNVGSVSSPNIERTGALIGNVEGSLYVDKNSVHTVQSGLNYAFAWFAATLYDIDKNVIANTGNENRNKYVAFISEENLKGANGYLNTGLTFDRPELPTPTEGAWVMRKGDYPALKMFVDEDDRMELVGDNMYRADTSWYNTTDTEFVINTVEELVGLSSLVSAGTSFEGKTVKIGEDIIINKGDAKEWAAGTNTQDLFPWTPIGISGKQFKGTFDGQGHNIVGMYAINPGLSTNSSTGLFGYVKNAKIQNISLLNGFASMEHRVGSFAANSETSEFINLYSNVIVKGTGNNIGGLVGELTYGGGFTNCWYDGTVTGGTYTGGLVGRTCVGDIKISGCLNSGTVSGTTNVGGFIGFSQEYQGTHVTLSNSINTGSVSGGNAGTTGALTGTVQGYLYVDKNSVHSVQAGPSYAFASVSATLYDNDKNVIAENKEQYISLIAISALHDLKAYNIVDRESWTARVDSYPIPSIFANGDYANAAKVGSDYANDMEFAGSGTAEDPYEISSAAELYGLALLSQTNSYAGVVFELTDNITVNPVTIDTSVADGTYYDWLPIGNGTYPFAGTFKGNGFTISGLYKARETEGDLGLFARTTVDAVVENFTLTNTYFHWLNGTSDAARMGAVVGRGGGTFSNIHSSAVVTSSWYGSGGILGEASSNTTITNCWFDGAVKGLRADGSSYTGGMIGLASGGDITIQHSLVSGSASAWKNVGGFIGGAKGTIQVTLEDNLFSGTILDGSSGYAGQFIGSVEGASTTTSATISKCFGVSDDVAEDIGKLVSGPAITGKAGSSVKADRLIGYTGTDAGLDFVTYWVLTKNSTPGLKTFTVAEDVYDGTGIDALLQLTYWDKTLANAEDKGAGNYMVTIDNAVLGETDGSTDKSYYGYLAALAAKGFATYGNDNGLNGEGVYNAIYTKGTEWVVNVTYISYKENDSVTPKIYITFNTCQPLSTHLKATDVASVDYSAADGYSVAQDKVTYHMLESSYAGFGAGSYIMQLKNGHFIIIDGGVYNDVAYLFEYLESLVEEGKKPIVEAWVFSHQHSDHMGPVLGIMQDVDTYKDRIYVEGFYYNEPNGDIVETYAKDSYSLVQALKNCAANVLTTTEGQAPQIYRIQTGQRYTFDDVTMDIMLSQELLTVADYEATYNTNNSYQQDSFNDTSTWCMFTIGEGADAQKLFSSGDGSYSGKKYVCDMYSSSYMTVDVFTALHHGLNTNMSQYMVLSNRYESVTQEAFSQKCTVEGVVLYSYKYDMTEENQTSNNNDTYAVNWKYAKLNDSFITYLEGKSNTFATGIPVLKNGITTNKNYLYFGEGACVLTFNGKTATNPITAEVLQNYSFTE